MDGNQPSSIKAKGSLTARPIRRAGTIVGLSDPTVPSGRAVAQQIKVTLGITGRSSPRIHHFSTYVFNGIRVFLFRISSSIVVKYFILKAFDDHIDGNKSFYAQKITDHFDVPIEVEIQTLERQQNVVQVH